MDRLLRMDREQFIARMLADVRRALGEVADAVNDAPDGAVLSGSEMRVRDVMGELRRKAFETAVQMRIDSTESSFSPAEGRGGRPQAEQGAVGPGHADGQRPGRPVPEPVARPGARAGRRQ
jgi:hypothetical protein